MSLLPQPTVMDSGALRVAEAKHHSVTVQKAVWQEFWQRDPEIVAAELNADVQKTLALFQLNSTAAQADNALLDAIGDSRFSNRAPDSIPPQWIFDIDGQKFVYAPPPPVIEEEPAP